MAHDDVIEEMRRPAFYPHAPAEVSLVQTHISYVFLAGPEVYKVKKPVRFPFLDFSTLEKRRFYCHEEVRLNRRLAADTYRGVVAIRPGESGYRISDDHDPAAVEYAVHMRRLPEDRILTALLDRGDATAELIDEVADRLARFHAAAHCDEAVTADGDPRAVSRLIEDNFAAARRFRGTTLEAYDDDAIQAYGRAFLRRNEALLRRRQSEHRIRECHGDLHSEHVCCADPLVIFDCIEFSARLRNCDVASEIAFLAMDLEFHGEPQLARRLVGRYAATTGDAALATLVPFYASYRAYVRGLVDSLTSAEAEVDPEERSRASRRAREHFALAQRYTWSDVQRLVVVMGLSGSGKSTLSRALHERTGFTHVTSDVVRKRLAGIPLRERPGPEGAAMLYTPEMSARTYGTMFEEAERELAQGRGVILDATFQRRADRDAAREVARRTGSPVLFVECECAEDEVRRRLRRRGEEDRDASDADWAIHVAQRSEREPPGAGEARGLLRVDTTEPIGGLRRAVESALRRPSEP